MKRFSPARSGWLLALISTTGVVYSACASDQKSTATAEEVRDGEALPPAPPVPAEPASTSSPTAPTVPGGVADATPPMNAPPTKESLTEAQIAKVTELVNTAEMEQGKLAHKKAKSPEVKKFGQMMAQHHGDALREQARIAKKLDIKAADSATAATLKAEGAQTLAKLESADAASFDSAYIASQIEGHQKALDLIDTQLLPNATTPAVTEALGKARVAVEQHLKQAQALQPK